MFEKEISEHFCEFPEDPTDVSHFFCKLCGKLSKPKKSSSYFHILGLKEEYLLSLQELEKNYLMRQRLLHPDQFVLKSEEERIKAEDYTMLLNEAYRILKSSALRGHHLLSLNKRSEESLKKTQDPLFLMMMMEAQERLKMLENEVELLKAKNEIKARLLKCEKAIGEAFESKDFQKASDLLDQLQYHMSLYKMVQEKVR
ncbi:MAG: Fe-S protein assembly co-chaperone HscB [Proteobacteria bacterium]|nr:Fe-S protein assembly co-chaperone HscB [Pseudomonadota bacterium]